MKNYQLIFKGSLFTTLICSFLFAQSYLSVFTESVGSSIYIDGDKVGTDQVIKHPVESGEHFVTVKWKGKTAFRKVIIVPENKTKIVVAEEFVEYKTDVANRGAVEMEAARIRDTRGNSGFGIFGPSPVPGLSLKHWINGRIGIQAIGYIDQKDDNMRSNSGGRLLINFSDRVYNSSVFSTYMALGAGKTFIQQEEEGYQEEISMFSFGIELNLLGNIAKNPEAQTKNLDSKHHYSTASSGEDMALQLAVGLISLISQAFLSVSDISLEIGYESHFKNYYKSATDKEPERWGNVIVSGGAHIYF